MALNQTLNQFNPLQVGTCLNSIALANRIKKPEHMSHHLTDCNNINQFGLIFLVFFSKVKPLLQTRFSKPSLKKVLHSITNECTCTLVF